MKVQEAIAELQQHVRREEEAALREALKAIPAAAGMDAFALAQHVTRKIMGDAEALYFDDTPLVLLHPVKVGSEGDNITATRLVERLL